jgi:hypothetical protein
MSREEINQVLSGSDIEVVANLARFVLQNGGNKDVFDQKLRWLRLDYSRLGGTHQERNKHRAERRRAMRAIFQQVRHDEGAQ